MKTKVFMSIAGLAACGAADAQDRPELQSLGFSGQVHQAVRATAITGLTVDGQYVYGRTIELGQNNNVARGGTTVAYDSALFADTDGDTLILDPVCGDVAPHTLGGASSRYFFGTEFSWQSYSEDFIPASGTESGTLSALSFAGVRPLCDNGAGTVSEPMQMIWEAWEEIDNFPDLDGSDGFDTDGDTLAFPFNTSDTDGDTLIDQFVGGVILTYADTDTDGDTINDEQLSAGALGYGIFFATGLETLGVSLPAGNDVFDGSGNATPDGTPDGGMRLQWTRGDDNGAGGGPLLSGFFPSTRASSMFWGTTDMEAAGTLCTYDDTNVPGFGAGTSDGTIWGEGEDLCNDPNNAGGAWSEGAPTDELINEAHDRDFDIADWFGIVPDFERLGLMIKLEVTGGAPTQDCCDVNQDNACTPTDFSAWINAFNNSLPTCDVNQDSACTPTDFSAWINAFNASTGGNPLQCTF
ncbi:MAG: hypothetical protein ED559_10435 [Phycisphaera sp.]|nr:MAG: hypothetical protein ED559_10435 [Phycisphaera sp.]